jgi:membrane-bound lytic murein transglycosylase B
VRRGMPEKSAGSDPTTADSVSKPSASSDPTEVVIDLDDSVDSDYRARHSAATAARLRSASFDGTMPPAAPTTRWESYRRRARDAAATVQLASVAGARATRRALRLPAGRLALTGAMLAALIGGTAAAGAAVVPELAKPQTATPPVESAQPVDPAPSPSTDLQPSTDPSPAIDAVARPADKFGPWATELSTKVEIPVVALQAYAYAEWVMSRTRPSCKLQWTTLAAIGKVESDHGRGGGSQLDQQGHSKPNILGPALTGAGGTKKITDTDAGALDGDKSWDRAVGSMQFLPSTWRAYAVDADADQLADPFDLDDAALAAAYYLCTSGKDMTVVADWKAVVLTYNNVGVYLEKVFETAQSYGTRSRT